MIAIYNNKDDALAIQRGFILHLMNMLDIDELNLTIEQLDKDLQVACQLSTIDADLFTFKVLKAKKYPGVNKN
jgi:hypothetical protein